VVNLTGGYTEWQKQKLPVEREESAEELVGAK